MTYTTISYDQDGDVAILKLNQPDRLNSFTSIMHAEIRDAFDKIEAAKTRAMVITGEGRGFCAGQDLADLDMTQDIDLKGALEGDFNPLIRRVKAAPFPVICAVNGPAAGAGANFALASDIVIAARSAYFFQAFAKIGLIPDAGGTWSLTRLAGPAKALGMAMLAEPVPAEQAEQWGLIWKVVEDDELMGEAMAIAEKLATQPTQAFALMKQAIAKSVNNTLDQQLDLEAKLQDIAGKTEDFAEGVDAFLNKRSPNFSGK